MALAYPELIKIEDREEWVECELTDPPLKKGDRVLAFVNSMGGTPPIGTLHHLS
jgi:dihydroxyacetone kinase